MLTHTSCIENLDNMQERNSSNKLVVVNER